MPQPTKSRPKPAYPTRTYSTVEVSSLACVSLRQLQWWDERKVLSPRLEGHRRVYFPSEAIEITVIAELRRKGVSLPRIRAIVGFLRKEMTKRRAELAQAGSELHLVTDGKAIYVEDRYERIIDLFKKAQQPLFLVCLSDQARRLDEVKRKPARLENGLNAARFRTG
jgi:DNA-binding transcriptional MerR regulator